jgi:hypothetical protein
MEIDLSDVQFMNALASISWSFDPVSNFTSESKV